MTNSVECLLEVNAVVVKVGWCSRTFAIMSLQSNICSTVLRTVPKLASPCWVAGQAYGPAVLAVYEASLLW